MDEMEFFCLHYAPQWRITNPFFHRFHKGRTEIDILMQKQPAWHIRACVICVIVNLLSKFTFYRHGLYVFDRDVREYTCESNCTVRINGHYMINLNLRLCNVKIRKLFVAFADSYNVADIELGCCVVNHNV